MLKITWFKKPKSRPSLQELYNAVKALKEKQGAGHFAVYVEWSGHEGGQIELRGYLDNPPRFETGQTIQEVCDKLSSYNKAPVPSPTKDIIL